MCSHANGTQPGKNRRVLACDMVLVSMGCVCRVRVIKNVCFWEANCERHCSKCFIGSDGDGRVLGSHVQDGFYCD